MKSSHRITMAALATAALIFAAGAARAEDTPLKPASHDGVLMFASEDDQFQWWFDVRVNLDGSFFVEDKNSLGDGVQARRLRFALKTVLWRDWYSEIDMDLAEEAVGMKDAYLRYDNVFRRTGYVRAGNFRQPFGLEENTTSRNLQFPERSQGTDGFVPGRKMGMELAHFAPRYRLAASVFGPDMAEFETESKDMTFSAAARSSYNCMRTESSVLHLGVAGAVVRPQYEATTVRFRTRNEYHVNNFKYVDTDNITGVERYRMVDGELAWVNRRVRLQTEHLRMSVTRNANRDPLSFGGGYVSASVFLTGDTHPYEWQTAEFGRLVPKSTKYGAWELVSRYSYVDMTDGGVTGGESTAFTVGLNWYANANIRFYTHYVMVDNDENANARGSLVGNDDFKFLEFRVQAAF